MVQLYDDSDANGLPIGLKNKITATAGNGSMTLTLRHLPPLNGMATKVADLAARVADGGFSQIAGTSDVQVNFMVTVE